MTNLQRALQIIHYVSPAAILAYYLLAKLVSTCTLHNLKASRTCNSKALSRLTWVILLSYMIESGVLLTDTAVGLGKFSSVDSNVSIFFRMTCGISLTQYQIYALSSSLVWMILIASDADASNNVSYPQYGSWLLALLAEGLLLAFAFGHGLSADAFGYSRVAIKVCRLLMLIALPTLLFSNPLRKSAAKDEESAALLGQDHEIVHPEMTQSNGTTPGYGSISTAPADAGLEFAAKQRQEDEKKKAKSEQKLQESGNLFRYVRACRLIEPNTHGFEPILAPGGC